MKIIDRKIIQRYYDKNKKTHNQLNNKVIESNEDLDNNIKINIDDTFLYYFCD